MVRGASAAPLAADVVGTCLSLCKHRQLLVLSFFAASSLFLFIFFFYPDWLVVGQ